MHPSEPDVRPPRLQPGQHFEGWQVEALWRRSRQAVLYRVRDAQGLPWLLKTLPEELATDSAARQALLHEEWLMRRLAGQSVADLHDMPGRRHLYFVQRQLDAQPLSTLLEQQGPWRLAIRGQPMEPGQQVRELAGPEVNAAAIVHAIAGGAAP